MSTVDALQPQRQPLDTADQRAQGLPAEAHLPAGKPLRSVQPLPLPLLSPQEGPKPAQEEQAMRREVALNRAGITGTGVIIDTMV
jgi:hypothetical protein